MSSFGSRTGYGWSRQEDYWTNWEYSIQFSYSRSSSSGGLKLDNAFPIFASITTRLIYLPSPPHLFVVFPTFARNNPQNSRIFVLISSFLYKLLILITWNPQPSLVPETPFYLSISLSRPSERRRTSSYEVGQQFSAFFPAQLGELQVCTWWWLGAH